MRTTPPQAYELTGVPPSGPLWKASAGKAAKLSVSAASLKAERDTLQRLNPFSVFIEVLHVCHAMTHTPNSSCMHTLLHVN